MYSCVELSSCNCDGPQGIRLQGKVFKAVESFRLLFRPTLCIAAFQGREMDTEPPKSEISRILIVVKVKTKLIASANQFRENRNAEPMRTQCKNKQTSGSTET